ncbi:MAG: hypothetical protein V4637_01160 [Pseudomonadota bacterium]
MNTELDSKYGSSIVARLNAARMSTADRAVAASALQRAEMMVDAVSWLVAKIEQLRERLFLRSALKH